MKEQIGLGAFGTFGEPFGYQQAFFLVPALQNSLDLKTNAIEVYPGSELYAVKREMADGVSSVSCCLYSYAKEANSNRGGTFVGACVVVNNGYLKGEAIYSLLKELHTDIISNPQNIVDNTLQVQKAAQLVVTEPASFNRIKTTISSVNAAKAVPIDTQSKFLIQAPADKGGINPVGSFFDTATIYFTHTDTLYFTTDERIVAYATEKGIIPVVQWDTFQDYKKQIIQQRKEAAKKATASKGEKGQAGTKNVKTIPKDHVTKATTYGLLEPWTNVETNLSREAFYKMVQNHNTLLQEYLKLSQQSVTAPSVSNKTDYPSNTSAKTSYRIKRKYLVLTILVLTILLVITSVLLLFRPGISNAVVPIQNVSAADSATSIKIATTPPSLVPNSNMELPKADIMKLLKDSMNGKKLDVVVDLLFIRNSKSIGEVYAGQKEAYAAMLVQQNEKCFRKDSIHTICTCDTLMHIPAFKK